MNNTICIMLIDYNYDRIFNRMVNIVLLVAKEKFSLILQQQVSIQFAKNTEYFTDYSIENEESTQIKESRKRGIEEESFKTKVEKQLKAKEQLNKEIDSTIELDYTLVSHKKYYSIIYYNYIKIVKYQFKIKIGC